jgi:polyisoprenoid-binding protein YceI
MVVRARQVSVVLALLGATAAAAGESVRWTAVADRSRLIIHVTRRGLLSGLAHDHHFDATSWQASASHDPGAPGAVRVELVVQAGSLRDRQEALSEPDRLKVDQRAAGPETLDAARFPEIRFVADRLVPAAPPPGEQEPGLDGSLFGTLTLHGQQRALVAPVHAIRAGEGWRVTGTVRFKQSEFGIEPYSGFAGTVGVRDEVEVEYELRLVPAPAVPTTPP